MKPMSAKVFTDTNIMLYLLSDDMSKKARSKQILSGQPVISLQVANEFTNVCIKKLKLAPDALMNALKVIEKYAVFVPSDCRRYIELLPCKHATSCNTTTV
jgi:predicted nucleic acid-binding protein